MRYVPAQLEILRRGLTAVCALLVITGCRTRSAEPEHADDPQPLPTTVPAPVTRTEQRQLPRLGQERPVKEGRAPLAYMVESAANVRIVDLETKQTLVTAAVEEVSPLLIDEKRGIRIGRQQLLAGPLPAGRRYAIYLDSEEAGYFRTGITEPGQPGQPE